MSKCVSVGRAVVALGCVFALYATVAHAQCPAPPASLGASGACDGVTIQWSGTAPGTQAVNIYRATSNSAASATLIGSAPGLVSGSFTDTLASTGVPYFYFLAGATTPSGACPGGVGTFSPSITATRPSPITSAPANLQASNPTCSPVNLSWSAVAGADSYAVYSSTTSTLPANPVPIGIVNATSYAAAIPSGATVNAYYFVAAANACGVGPRTLAAQVSLAGAPAPVTNTYATRINACTAIQVSWSPTDRAQQYTVFASINEGSFTLLGTTNAPATTLTHTPSAGQTRWSYLIIASNGCGQSAPGATANINLAQGPSVVSTPASLAVNAGQPVTLVATIENASSLRWKRDGVDLVDTASISGATTNQLRISLATPASAGVYTLSATNCAGAFTSSGPIVVAVRQTCAADIDFSGSLTLDDIFIFINSWFAGCP